jgi:4-amino-4-deoxy-L-arabinose transferase-like glycosyltransferase
VTWFLPGIRLASRAGAAVAGEPEVRAAPMTSSEPRGRLFLPWALRHTELIPLALVLAVGATLRFWRLGAVGFNSDEAVYAGQAAAIAGDPTLSGLFPVFRAHPLLFQTVLSLEFLHGVSDVGARVLAVAFGLATVAVVYLLGKALYGGKTGLVAALFIAVMPYHVVVTRQVLLDGPQTFFAVLALYCLVRYCTGRATRWLYASAAAFGLTILTKEVAAVLVLAVLVFFVLRREFRLGWRKPLIALGILVVLVSAYPLSLALSGRKNTGQNYLVWQFFRRPNHTLAFYFQTVPGAIGIAVLVLAVAGLWLLRREVSWREWLLGCWVLVPLAFFEIWPTKGYQYLLPVAPALAVLAARTVVRAAVPVLKPMPARVVRGAVIVAAAVSLVVPSWQAVNPAPSSTFLAGSGGVPGGREAGQWIGANLPQGSRILALGPSMANLVQFYGHRRAYGLSVSPNPLSRNPSYEPVDNPDRQLRERDLQYVVWDAYSAARAPFFSQQLLRYVQKYRGVAVHTESISVPGAAGEQVPKPVIIVYEVRP